LDFVMLLAIYSDPYEIVSFQSHILDYTPALGK